MVSTGSPVRIRPSALPLQTPFGGLRGSVPGTASSPARSCSLCPRLSVFVRTTGGRPNPTKEPKMALFLAIRLLRASAMVRRGSRVRVPTSAWPSTASGGLSVDACGYVCEEEPFDVSSSDRRDAGAGHVVVSGPRGRKRTQSANEREGSPVSSVIAGENVSRGTHDQLFSHPDRRLDAVHCKCSPGVSWL